jgi:hypothetical protein
MRSVSAEGSLGLALVRNYGTSVAILSGQAATLSPIMLSAQTRKKDVQKLQK